MEFFLVLPLIVLVLVAGLEVVDAARTRMELAAAARDGARVAATTPDPARAVSAVQNALPEELRSRARVSVTRPVTPGRVARVRVTLLHSLHMPLLDHLEVEIGASAAMLVER